MTQTEEAGQYAEVDFMLHTPIYRQPVELIEFWPPPLSDQYIQRMTIKPDCWAAFSADWLR